MEFLHVFSDCWTISRKSAAGEGRHSLEVLSGWFLGGWVSGTIHLCQTNVAPKSLKRMQTEHFTAARRS